MELSSFTGIAAAVSVIIGLAFALRSRKKGGPKKVKELYDQLLGIGVDAFIPEEDIPQHNGIKPPFGEKPAGTIGLRNKDIESVSVLARTHQHGTNYYLDYLVRSPLTFGMDGKGKTRMIKRKSSPLWGKVISIEWKGDESLAQGLNYDTYLNNLLLQAAPRGGVKIFPEPRSEYARIRTRYSLPSADMFEALEMIARHVKSWS